MSNVMRISTRLRQASLQATSRKSNRSIQQQTLSSCRQSNAKYKCVGQQFSSSSMSNANNSDSLTDANGFTVFYRFNKIVFARLLSRMKLYQTAMCTLALPPMFYMSNTGALSWESTYVASGVAAVAYVVLFAMTGYLRRLIGLMSYNKETDMVKVAHLTFWGGRKNVYLDAKDIVPLSELPDDISREVLIKFKTYSKDDHLFFTLKYGTVFDNKTFEHVFGKFDYLMK